MAPRVAGKVPRDPIPSVNLLVAPARMEIVLRCMVSFENQSRTAFSNKHAKKVREETPDEAVESTQSPESSHQSKVTFCLGLSSYVTFLSAHLSQ